MKYKIGIDVGGTFTDFFLVSDKGDSVMHKTLSTPEDSSEGNFLFVYFENEKERDFFFDLLEEKKVLARKTDLFGENSAFRITIGTPEMNEIVIQHLREIKVANY